MTPENIALRILKMRETLSLGVLPDRGDFSKFRGIVTVNMAAG